MLHHNENADSTSADRAQTAATSAHRIFPAGTGIRDLSIRDLPFRVFGELGPKRRYVAGALPEAMFDAGARAKTVTKAVKSGQKRPKVATHDDFPNFYSLLSQFLLFPSPFPGARQRGVTKGAKKCQRPP